MSIPEFDVAMEVSKLKATPAISAIPAIRQGENSKNSRNSSPHLRIVPTATAKNSKNSKNSSPPLPDGQGQSIPLPTGPAPEGTGLEWIVKPTDPDAPGYDAHWAAYDLADLGKLYSIRVVRAGERVLAVYPPELPAELVAYASALLAEAQGFLRQHMDCLPILEPAEAVKAILEIMRRHDGLRFTRGDDGSLWPLYPAPWAAGQRVTLQALWFAAGDALDRDDFIMEETEYDRK